MALSGQIQATLGCYTQMRLRSEDPNCNAITWARRVHGPAYERSGWTRDWGYEGQRTTYQKNPPTRPVRRRGMSTSPSMGFPRSTAVTLFPYAERTSHGRSICPSCRSTKRPSAQKKQGEHGTYDNRRLTEDYVCSLKRVGR